MENVLAERAMLVNIRVSMWSGRMKDAIVSNEVCANKKAEADAGAWWTYTVPKSFINPIEAAGLRVREVNNKLTLPWTDRGLRILPAEAFLDYRTEMAKYIAIFDEKVQDFLRAYPDIIATKAERLGGLVANLPSVDEIKGKFGIYSDIVPVPTEVKDFRVDIPAEELQKMKDGVNESAKILATNATKELWKRMGEVVSHIAEVLGEEKKIFRDTMVTSLKDFCETIRKYNVNECPEVVAVSKEIQETLGKLKTDDLRENKEEREKAAKEAEEIKKKINGFFGK